MYMCSDYAFCPAISSVQEMSTSIDILQIKLNSTISFFSARIEKNSFSEINLRARTFFEVAAKQGGLTSA